MIDFVFIGCDAFLLWINSWETSSTTVEMVLFLSVGELKEPHVPCLWLLYYYRLFPEQVKEEDCSDSKCSNAEVINQNLIKDEPLDLKPALETEVKAFGLSLQFIFLLKTSIGIILFAVSIL